MLKKVYALELLGELKGKKLLDKSSSKEILRDIRQYLEDEADSTGMK